MNLEFALDSQTIASRDDAIMFQPEGETPLASTEHTLEDNFASMSVSSACTADNSSQAPTFVYSEFETDLESSKVYRRAKRKSMDFSFHSSIAPSNAWSMFSGLSLDDVSIIAVIALPIYPDDITNAQHYSFGWAHERASSSALIQPPDAAGSLFYDCSEIKRLLLQLPEFLEWFQDAEAAYVGDPMNPVRELKHVLMRGVPLLVLLNHNNTLYDLERYTDPKYAVYTFLAFCKFNKLGPESLFTIGDLLGDGYAGLYKVRCVNQPARLMLITDVYRLEGCGYASGCSGRIQHAWNCY
jgi:hypothetical protein